MWLEGGDMAFPVVHPQIYTTIRDKLECHVSVTVAQLELQDYC